MFSIYSRLLGNLRPYRGRVLLAALSILLFALMNGSSLTLVVPFLDNLFQEEAVTIELPAPAGEDASWLEKASVRKDRILGSARLWLDRGERSERLFRGLWVILLAYFLKNLFDYLQAFLVHLLEQRSLYDIRGRLFAHLQTLPLAWHQDHPSGSLVSRVVNDVNTLRGALVGAPAVFFRNLLVIFVGLTIIFAISWRLALLTFLIVPVNAFLLRFLGRLLRRDGTRIQERMADMASAIGETLVGVRVVKAFGREEYEEKRFDRFNLDYYRRALRLRALGALNAPLSEILGSLSVVLIVGYGGIQVLAGNLEASHLVLFVVAVLSIVGPLRRISDLNQFVQEGAAAGERIFEVLDAPDERRMLDEGTRPGALKESIQFEGLGFSYREGHPVLQDLDFSLPRGKVLALVGPSGAGKSTVADLLARFRDPVQGRILMDGIDIEGFRLSDWRNKFGIVTQDVILFNDTILNNIAYGRPGASREEVEAAAKMARAHDFILEAPEGYDTVIGERGLQLSGGQRQRLAIARALLKDPEILIFDEATSSLDTKSEALVQEAIEGLMKERTSLVIAHRLSTVRRADRILVLEGGRKAEEGSHEELMDSGKLYRQLHDLQFREPEEPEALRKGEAKLD
ncbi:MAG: ABC transporter ATP-binding protein [Candidatus Krumholzibacteria bacterium]|jgi:subfamily B ATP-binding cassette protein MsbA|nr:ABC transporter ATP-binding protein [Candidatus Krumholzibacteria bacterium]